MNLSKILDFTKQLEYSMVKLMAIPDISEHKKDALLKKLDLLSAFNKRFQYDSKIDTKANNL